MIDLFADHANAIVAFLALLDEKSERPEDELIPIIQQTLATGFGLSLQGLQEELELDSDYFHAIFQMVESNHQLVRSTVRKSRSSKGIEKHYWRRTEWGTNVLNNFRQEVKALLPLLGVCEENTTP